MRYIVCLLNALHPYLANRNLPMADETEVGNAVVAKAPSPGCAICTQIVEFFGTTVHGDKASLGLVSALIETPCPHGEWIKSFSAKANNLPGFAEGKMTIEKLGQSARLTFKVKEVPYHTELVRLVHRQEIARRYAGRGLILDSSWVNEALISLWKDLCHIHHGDACQHPARLQHVRASCPTWLIDTVEACLVPGREYISYVTLSYTRGDTTKLFNEKGILDQLQNPGILQAGILAERLSQTVRNAIDLVRLLGERYLWVDSLCIVQDDVEQVQTALDMMATIYKSSRKNNTQSSLDSRNTYRYLSL